MVTCRGRVPVIFEKLNCKIRLKFYKAILLIHSLVNSVKTFNISFCNILINSKNWTIFNFQHSQNNPDSISLIPYSDLLHTIEYQDSQISNALSSKCLYIWNLWKLLFIQSGTYVKNNIAEVTVFSHHVQRLQSVRLVHLVDEFQRRCHLLFVFGYHFLDVTVTDRGGFGVTWNKQFLINQSVLVTVKCFLTRK